jgi:hypothetical protein
MGMAPRAARADPAIHQVSCNPVIRLELIYFKNIPFSWEIASPAMLDPSAKMAKSEMV